MGWLAGWRLHDGTKKLPGGGNRDCYERNDAGVFHPDMKEAFPGRVVLLTSGKNFFFFFKLFLALFFSTISPYMTHNVYIYLDACPI